MTDSATIDVALPSEAPSGEALFAWTWFNNAGTSPCRYELPMLTLMIPPGNREMYMNCAAVTVTNGGSGLSGPTPFVANANVNECKTIEGVDVVFPNPGAVIHYGGSYTSSRPTTPAGFSGSNCVGPGASALPDKTAASSAAVPSSEAPSSTVQTSTAAATSSPVVNEHAVSTSEASATTTAVTSDVVPTDRPVSTTATATASAITSTSTSLNGKVRFLCLPSLWSELTLPLS